LIAVESRIDAIDERPTLQQYCELPQTAPPALVTVVDTEEEFDWSAPFDRAHTAVSHMAAIHRVQELFETLGVIPSYLLSYPIVAQEAGFRPLEPYIGAGRAAVGAHLNAWTTPPHREPLNRANSYPGNLPRELEAAKLAALCRQIERSLGIRPLVYKAGRYGKGPHTEAMDFAADGGPDYTRHSTRPFLFGRERRLLCLPTTGAFVGRLHPFGPLLHPLMEQGRIARLRPLAIASRLRLLERIRLTPEGHTLAEMKRLTRALLARGQRTFVLSLHSPSVVPGHTPYVHTDADLMALLQRLGEYLRFFRDGLRGRFVTPQALKAELEQRASDGPGGRPID
jgi:hypothetical protein